MIDVIQIYKSKELFIKSNYTTENRNKFNDLIPSFTSTNGFLDNNLLVLPNEYRNFPDIKTAELIIIQDIDCWNPFFAKQYYETLDLPEWYKNSRFEFLVGDHKRLFILKHLSIPKNFELFKLWKSNNNTYELFIDYRSNSTKIGLPARENHKICELEPSKPVRYRINGKSDFTLTGRKERTFYEYDYIIEWLGKADTIEFREMNKISSTKEIPIDHHKLIDERKLLK